MEKEFITPKQAVKMINQLHRQAGLPETATIENFNEYMRAKGWYDENNELTSAAFATGLFKTGSKKADNKYSLLINY
jgi:hypothetical protein